MIDSFQLNSLVNLPVAGELDFGLSRARRAVSGHFWTLAPALRNYFARTGGVIGRPFQTTLRDPMMGAIRLSGMIDELPGADSLILIVHGSGGSAESSQCIAMARAARMAGISSLRLSLRGADLSGDDIYHGGLTTDLQAALGSVELRAYQQIFIAGYSVGGNIALHAALEHIDPRIRSVAAICSPLDVAAGADEFDKPSRSLYRRYVFGNLNRVYAATAARRPLPVPVEVVRRARTTRERDDLAVVPRFGFASVDDYYRRVRVCDKLHRLDVPSLFVASRNDPVVSFRTLRPALAQASRALTTCCLDAGGHISFPNGLNLGQAAPSGLENQVVHWLLNH